MNRSINIVKDFLSDKDLKIVTEGSVLSQGDYCIISTIYS